MAEFTVPVTVNGQEYEIPVSGVEDEDAARAEVQRAVDAGELDQHFTVERPDAVSGSVDPRARLQGKIAFDAVQGAFGGIANALEFGLLATKAILPDEGPKEDAVQGLLNQFRAARRQVEVANVERARQLFGGSGQPSIMSQLLGEMLVFGPIAPQGATWKGVVGQNITLGAMFGGMGSAPTAEELSDTIGSASIGAIVGLGVGGLQAPQGFAAYAGRKFNAELQRDVARQGLLLEKEVQRLTGNPNFTFSIPQLVADNPWFLGLSKGAVGRQTLDHQNRNLQTLVTFLNRRGQGLEPEQFVDELSDTVITTVDKLHETASTVYRTHLDEIMGLYGDDVILDGRKYLDDLRATIGAMGDERKIGASAVTALRTHEEAITKIVEPYIVQKTGKTYAVLNRRTNEIERVTENVAEAQQLVAAGNAKAGLRSDDLVTVLQGHNELLAGDRSLWELAKPGSGERVAKRLKESLLTSMDGSNADAVKAIRDLQKSYQYEMERVRQITNSQLGQIFGRTEGGLEKMLENPEAALDKLMTFKPKAMTKARDLLEATNPELLDSMKTVYMERLVEKAVNPQASAGQNIIDLGKLMTGLSGRGAKDTRGLAGLGLFTAAEQGELIAAAKAMSHLKTTYIHDIASAAEDVKGKAADAVINLIARSPEFFGRWITRYLTGSKSVEAFLLDPNARKALIHLGEKGPDNMLGKMAIVYLSSIDGAIRAAEAQEERMKGMQEMQKQQEYRR